MEIDNKTVDSIRARRYLLGSLPDEERSAWEEVFFADDSAFQALELAEWDLVDDFLSRSLTDDESVAFERHFLNSSERLRMIAIAKGLKTELVQEPAPVRRPVASFRPMFAAMAAAFVGVVMAGSIWLALHFRAETASLRQQQEAAIVVAQQKTASLQRELDQQTKRSAVLESQNSPPKQTKPAATHSPLSFILTPGVLRGEQSLHKLLVPLRAGSVRFILKVEGRDTPKQFRVRIVSSSQVQIWSNLVKPLKSRPSQPAPFEVPSSVLRPGQYLLFLDGLTEETLSDYSFEIVRR